MKTKISFFVPRNWKNIVITRGPLNCCKTLWQFIICECRRDPSRNRYTPENEWMSPKEEPIFERELHLPTSNHPFSAKKTWPKYPGEFQLVDFFGFQATLWRGLPNVPLSMWGSIVPTHDLGVVFGTRVPFGKFVGGDPNPYWSTENSLRHITLPETNIFAPENGGFQ